MIVDNYGWHKYHDRSVRNLPKNEWEEKLAEEQSEEIVNKLMSSLEGEPAFKKRVLKKLGKHVVGALDKPKREEEQEDSNSLIDDDDSRNKDTLL
jgi:hypothetical protein